MTLTEKRKRVSSLDHMCLSLLGTREMESSLGATFNSLAGC